jgi:hypothetical protein
LKYWAKIDCYGEWQDVTRKLKTWVKENKQPANNMMQVLEEQRNKLEKIYKLLYGARKDDLGFTPEKVCQEVLGSLASSNLTWIANELEEKVLPHYQHQHYHNYLDMVIFGLRATATELKTNDRYVLDNGKELAYYLNLMHRKLFPGQIMGA